MQKRTDHGVNHGSSGTVILSFCQRTLATVPSDLVNHDYDGLCGNRMHLIELPRMKSQVEKRRYMLYRVTFHGIRHNEAPMVHNELEKKKGRSCACMWRVTGTRGARAASSGSRTPSVPKETQFA